MQRFGPEVITESGAPALPANSNFARRRTLVYQWKPADVPNLPVSRSYLRKTFRVGHCAISDAIFLSESGPLGIPGEIFGDLREPGRVRGRSADLHAQLLPGEPAMFGMLPYLSGFGGLACRVVGSRSYGLRQKTPARKCRAPIESVEHKQAV